MAQQENQLISGLNPAAFTLSHIIMPGLEPGLA